MRAGDILLVLVPIAFLFLLFSAQRRRQRQATHLQAQLTPGSRVCTTSGMFGTVVALTDKEVVIEAAPGVNLRFDRRAIGLVVPSEGPTGGTGPDATSSEPGTSGETDGHDKPA